MRKNFPDKVRMGVSHDKPKEHANAAHDLASKCVIIILVPKENKNSSFLMYFLKKNNTVLKPFKKC